MPGAALSGIHHSFNDSLNIVTIFNICRYCIFNSKHFFCKTIHLTLGIINTIKTFEIHINPITG